MLRVGSFTILGDHETGAQGLAIRLYPGTGWGFGWHPSTQAVLRAMESYGLSGHSVADVGTGVGILAIAAHLLGADQVVAVEVQPSRAESARRNFKLNSSPIEVFATKGLDFDVEIVVANLGATASTLDALKHATQGFIVTVDEIDVPLVHESAEAAGFVVDDVETFSNVGPKPEPIPSNFISHVLVGKRA